METQSEADRDGAVRWAPGWQSRLYFLAALWPGILALLAPLTEGEIRGRLGFLLIVTALLEMTHGFRRASWEDQRAAWSSGVVSLGLGLLLMHAPYFATGAFQLLTAAWFGVDVARNFAVAVRSGAGWATRRKALFATGGNAAAMLAILLLRESWIAWTLAAAAAVRIFLSAWNSLISPLMSEEFSAESVTTDFGFVSGSEADSQVRTITAEERSRTAIDRGWIFSFLMTLLAIHAGRMGYDRTFVGLLSPGFAVLGDLFAALVLAFLVMIPLLATTNRMTRPMESFAWQWCTVPGRGRGWIRRPLQFLLTFRLRMAIRLRLARCSLSLAVSRGLQMGLPVAAVIAATAPMWGMSWYFDTENWAAGIWNSWAAQRTDTWRAAMAEAVLATAPQAPLEERFLIDPPDTDSGPDFAFLVIGDPGEGDASQHVLRSEFLRTVRHDDVRFVVISSDVVYPTGAMRNYESNFWLPFMGTEKPVYAIPGNHDWYDALEGFIATFFEPAAARAAMRARVDVDNRITSTTDSRIDELIAQATRLRAAYRVPTQLQQAPYFQFRTDSFALFAVDTGVTRSIDPVQRKWLEAALEAAGSRTKMVILGHPFLAGGHDLSATDPEFQELRTLLRQHDVSVVMAGDTHDLEYYREPPPNRGSAAAEPSPPIHHFVNGGGGAYLSFGTALDWPAVPVTSEWGFYPPRSLVESMIETTIPGWKRPAWIWTRTFSGWPFSAEWLSAAFDANVAPFYQSFIEVRVEASRSRLRLIPHGIHGPLHYADLQMSPGSALSEAEPGTPVEWIIPLVTRAPRPSSPSGPPAPLR